MGLSGFGATRVVFGSRLVRLKVIEGTIMLTGNGKMAYTRLLKVTIKNTDKELVAAFFVPLTFKEDYNPLLENNQCHISWELINDCDDPKVQRVHESDVPLPRDAD